MARETGGCAVRSSDLSVRNLGHSLPLRRTVRAETLLEAFPPFVDHPAPTVLRHHEILLLTSLQPGTGYAGYETVAGDAHVGSPGSDLLVDPPPAQDLHGNGSLRPQECFHGRFGHA